MIQSVDRFRGGDLDLAALVRDLQGLLGATDLHDEHLIDGFWTHEAPIDMELELRTEAWAPSGSTRDESLERALGEFQDWARRVLDQTDDDRT